MVSDSKIKLQFHMKMSELGLGSNSVGYERKFFELERAERKNFRAEPSTSENYKINFQAEPSSSGKSFEQLRAASSASKTERA